MRSVFGQVPVALRFWAAAGLSLVPLGLVWSHTASYLTPGYYGPESCDIDGYCTPGIYTPGVLLPGSTTTGSETSARIFLVGAAIALIWVAAHVRAPLTRRIARLAVGALAIAAALAIADAAVSSAVCVLIAVALAAPPSFAAVPGQPPHFGVQPRT